MSHSKDTVIPVSRIFLRDYKRISGLLEIPISDMSFIANGWGMVSASLDVVIYPYFMLFLYFTESSSREEAEEETS